MLYLFFFNDTATTEIYTLSLHDALPISPGGNQCASSSSSLMPRRLSTPAGSIGTPVSAATRANAAMIARRDRKSTRLNSSHQIISYAVFCLKKKKNKRDDDFGHRIVALL